MKKYKDLLPVKNSALNLYKSYPSIYMKDMNIKCEEGTNDNEVISAEMLSADYYNLIFPPEKKYLDIFLKILHGKYSKEKHPNIYFNLYEYAMLKDNERPKEIQNIVIEIYIDDRELI